MKKLALIFMLVAMLSCLFVLSVSAAETNEFGEVEVVEGMSEKSVFGDDGQADSFTTRIVLFDGTEYHTYPSYYVFTNNVNTTYDFSQLNEKTGKGYKKESAIRVEVPHNVQKVTGDIFNRYNNLKYVLFPDTLKEISGNMFYTSHGLEWVNVPRDCTIIGQYAFYGCASLVTIDMTNAKSLKKTESNQFYNCPKLEELIFPEGFEYFGGAGGGGSNYQNGLGSLKTLYLPDTVTYMGCIAEMKSIGTFTVPLGIKSIRASQFSYCTGLKKLVLHNEITSIDEKALDMTLYLTEVVYTGFEGDEIVGSISKAFGKATITYGSLCTYYYGDEHLNDTNPCVINCTRCNWIGVAKENPVHSVFESIVYANGFDNVGAKVTACANQGCLYESSTETRALFTCIGYSAPEEGDNGDVALGYLVDNDAIVEYEKATKTTVKYGVFAVSQEKLGNASIFDENGVAANGVVKADVTVYGLAAFELKIVGFTGTQKDIRFAMGAYVMVTDGVNKEYSYMQYSAPNEGDKYSFASFNEIMAQK